ncbi:MAG: PQQ-dependent sugar dehydrogenase [Burkholderiales bacterium]|nr:PQQ-dependent sugar dehydrogenase [Burkholderiales bacterium]
MAASLYLALPPAPDLGARAAEYARFDSQLHRFRVVTLVRGLEHPWGLAFLPDGRLLVTERPGRLRIVAQGRLDPQPVQGLPPIRQHGQGGLLDVALHPRHAENGWLYLSYAGQSGQAWGTEVLRGRLKGGRLIDVQVIFRMQPKLASGFHFGSRLVFDRDGRLYVTLGDRGEQARAQRLDDHVGAVVRILDDGRVPPDNPFIGQEGVLPEIYSYGHRNIQGAALHPHSGRVWVVEHGPQGGDEVNVLYPGLNYGWPVITYGTEYGTGAPIGEGTHKPGMVQPLKHWTPSIAPSGAAFYTGDRFPRWRGDLLVGALRHRMLVRLRLAGERVVEEERMLEGIGRIRDVRVGPDGLVYLLTDEPDGRLLRLEPID